MVSLSVRGVFLSRNGRFEEHNFPSFAPVFPPLNNEGFLGSSFLIKIIYSETLL